MVLMRHASLLSFAAFAVIAQRVKREVHCSVQASRDSDLPPTLQAARRNPPCDGGSRRGWEKLWQRQMAAVRDRRALASVPQSTGSDVDRSSGRVMR